MKMLRIAVLLLVTMAFMAACGGGAKVLDVGPQSVKLMSKGQTATLTATFKDATGKAIEEKAEIVWTSSDPAVATVANGTVTAVNTGKATITATAGKVSGSAKVHVQIPGSIKLSTGMIKIDKGEKRQIDATVLDTKGEAIAGANVKWNSGNAKVAHVTGGAVMGMSDGKTKITASYSGITESLEVTVGSGESKGDVDELKGVGKKKPPKKIKLGGVKKKGKK